MISREALKQTLLNTHCEISFVKKDGSQRIIRCSLNENIIVPHEKTTDRVKTPNVNVLPVWDTENKAWRSINIGTIERIEILWSYPNAAS